MKGLPWVASAFLLGAAAGCDLAAPDKPAAADKSSAAPEVQGRTRCPLSRRGIIAPAILRPVVEVLVAPGDRVKKGQVLVKLNDSEARAKVRSKEAELHSAQIRAKEARQLLEGAEGARGKGALPENAYLQMRAAAQRGEQEERAAQAELTSARGELELYSVTAPIDGEVAWLDVSPGTVSWPGSVIWGEVVDLREIDVRCEMTPAQAAQVTVGQSAEVRQEAKGESEGTARVTCVGALADRNTGSVPVLLRLANPKGRLRGEVPVTVRFLPGRAAGSKKEGE